MSTKTKIEETVQEANDKTLAEDGTAEVVALKRRIAELEASLNNALVQKKEAEALYTSQIQALQNDLTASRDETATANFRAESVEAEKNSIIKQFEEQRDLLQKVSDSAYTYRSALIAIIKDIN